MTDRPCTFARAADNTPICPVHKQQLTLESKHGNLKPEAGNPLKGRCPVSGQLVVEKIPAAVPAVTRAA